jgi:hypothetical protein
VTNHASRTFEVKLNPQTPDDNVGDPTVGRMSIDKQFLGDLEASTCTTSSTRSPNPIHKARVEIKIDTSGHAALERLRIADRVYE